MKEKDFQSLFTKWIRENKYNQSTAWELKITKEKSLPFSRIEEHQINKLKEANKGCVYHKISDQAMGFKPFDCLQVCNVPAYLVVLYYKPRQKKEAIWIAIDDLINEIQTSKRKSLLEERAKEISYFIHVL